MLILSGRKGCVKDKTRKKKERTTKSESVRAGRVALLRESMPELKNSSLFQDFEGETSLSGFSAPKSPREILRHQPATPARLLAGAAGESRTVI
jgi:hypothetical protein